MDIEPINQEIREAVEKEEADKAEPLAVCAVTLVLLPGAQGMSINPHDPADGQVERMPTAVDMRALCMEWMQHLQSLSNFHTEQGLLRQMQAQQRQGLAVPGGRNGGNPMMNSIRQFGNRFRGR